MEYSKSGNYVYVQTDDGIISSKSVESNLLFGILEKLEEIRCGIIDCEPK